MTAKHNFTITYHLSLEYKPSPNSCGCRFTSVIGSNSLFIMIIVFWPVITKQDFKIKTSFYKVKYEQMISEYKDIQRYYFGYSVQFMTVREQCFTSKGIFHVT
jgi:hypothetical protein